MLAQSVERLVDLLDDDALVLDVGGWAKPFARADWVLDLLPYASRGTYGWDGRREDERFSARTWVQRDICDREPWPFDDGQFDFVVCSHTLEDVRDPVWVCSEMNRVGQAGYLETPARLEEQTVGVQGPWVGWSHHHWLVEKEGGDGLVFVFKPHVLNGRRTAQFPHEILRALPPEERVMTLWWEGSFRYRERIFIGYGEIDEWLDAVVRDHAPHAAEPPAPLRRPWWRRLAGAMRRLVRPD